MNVAIRLSILVIFSFGINLFAWGQVTNERIVEAIRLDGIPALRKDINALPKDARRASALEVVRFTAKEFVSNREYHSGKALLSILPDIADDELLVNGVRGYLDHQDSTVRRIAFEALSRGIGPAVGQLLAQKIGPAFERMPSIPFHAVDESRSREFSDQGVIFVYCLSGLFRSESEPAREAGVKYLRLLRDRYSGSADGQLLLQSIEQELSRAGISIDNYKSTPNKLSVGAGQQTPAIIPESTPTAAVAPKIQQTPDNTSVTGPESSSSALWFIVGGIACLVAAGLAFVFLRTRS